MVPVSNKIEQVLLGGDMSGLTVDERLEYYNATCKSLGLNPLTRPFEYIVFRPGADGDDSPASDTRAGKMVLYARADCTAQLRKIHGIGVSKLEKVREGEYYYVTASVVDKYGKPDIGTGVVWLKNRKTKADLTGVDLANAMMRAETKAKRRATLSCAGLGMMDESEIEDLPQGYGTVTAGGRVMYKELSEGERAPTPAEKQAEIVKEKTKGGSPKADMEGAFLFYEVITIATGDRPGRYKIDGTHSLKKEHRDLLLGKNQQWWDGKLGAIFADDYQLDHLKYEFGHMKPPVPFRYLKPAEKPAREPGE